MLFILLILSSQVIFGQCELNNACKDYQSYFYLYFSKNCYYIPDNDRHTPELIKYHTGVSETHKITTPDGYILTIHRIPRKKSKRVVLFQHGMGQDSRAWMAQYKDSIALKFWEKGYDVWLGNSRGSHYSKGHIKLNNDNSEYWDFDYHEMGYFDLNSTIDYIKESTNVSKIFYVGHSMGAISGAIYSSLRPQDAGNSVRVMVLLAPVCYSQDSPSPLRAFAGFIHFILSNNIHRMVRIYSFPEYDSILFRAFRAFNKLFPFKYIWSMMASWVGGWSPDEFDPNYINLAVDLSGSGTALKIYAHGYQLTRPNVTFEMYDYGTSANLEKYGSERPPEYPLEKIKVPLFIIYGQKDSLSFKKNIEAFAQRLQPEANYGQKEVEGFNHIDFFWGKHRKEGVYNEIFKAFERAIDEDNERVCKLAVD